MDQDWTPVTITRSNQGNGAKAGTSSRSSAGGITRKYGSGGNKQTTGGRKVGEFDTAKKIKVNPDLARTVIDTRIVKGMKKQKDLASRASVPIKAVNDLERGKLPTVNDHKKICRALGIRIPRTAESAAKAKKKAAAKAPASKTGSGGRKR